MEATVFAHILEDLVRSVPGADGAVFVDWEGEAVDQFSLTDGTRAVRLMGAHWGIIYNLTRRAIGRLEMGRPAEILLRFGDQHVLIRRITDEYLVVMSLARHANLGRALERSRVAAERLRGEM